MNEVEGHHLTDNTAQHRLELPVTGGVAFIDYHRTNSRITLVHTEVPEALRGQGIASTLVEEALRYIQGKGWTLVVLCSFIQRYLQKHPEWTYLLDKSVRVKGFNDQP